MTVPGAKVSRSQGSTRQTDVVRHQHLPAVPACPSWMLVKSESEDVQGAFMHSMKHAVSCVSGKLGRASGDGLTRLLMATIGGGRSWNHV